MIIYQRGRARDCRVATRDVFRATFVGIDSEYGYMGPDTVPIVQLSYISFAATGKRVADTLTFNLTKGFAALDLNGGDKVEFDARVRPSEDAPNEFELDYPTKVKKIV
jgi:hypothetical protein